MKEIKYEQMGVKKLMQICGLCQVKTVNEGGDHEEVHGRAYAYDDVTGDELDPKEVRKARDVELAYARDKRVWTKIPRATAVQQGWKIIKTRWIDINKRSSEQPKYRSRFVGKEYNDGEGDGLFASTPP